MHFLENIRYSAVKNNSILCIGLDPDISKFPSSLQSTKNSVFLFNKEIIDATADLVCCYKPQIAYYSAIRAEYQLEITIDYIHKAYPGIPVILDAKRNDIGSTAEMYAKEAFLRYEADALTINPYMGSDTVMPFLSYTEKGIIVLCKTSNPGSSDFQNLMIDGKPLFIHIAEKAQHEWNQNGNTCLVVGATYPDDLRYIRNAVPDLTFLVPGIGMQGGDITSVVKNGINEKGEGLIINSSRAIIHIDTTDKFAKKARESAMNYRNSINNARFHQ